MTTQPVDISVFGRSFRVNCPLEQKEALEFAALDLDNRLNELKQRTRVSNIEQLVFIAALNVCHELAQERNKTAEYANQMENRIKILQSTIEKALLQHASLSDLEEEETSLISTDTLVLQTSLESSDSESEIIQAKNPDLSTDQ